MTEDSKNKVQTVAREGDVANGRKPADAEIAWEQNTLQPALKKNPERRKDFTTISGHPIRGLYTQADLSGFSAQRDESFHLDRLRGSLNR